MDADHVSLGVTVLGGNALSQLLTITFIPICSRVTYFKTFYLFSIFLFENEGVAMGFFNDLLERRLNTITFWRLHIFFMRSYMNNSGWLFYRCKSIFRIIHCDIYHLIGHVALYVKRWWFWFNAVCLRRNKLFCDLFGETACILFLYYQ